MFPFTEVTGYLWLAFYIFWIGWAVTSKKTAHYNRQGFGIVIRIGIILSIFLFIRLQRSGVLPVARNIFRGYPVIETTGMAVCVLGFALAIWARIYLGRNWGIPMSLKEEPELVTSGPYHVIRHPIYTGILLAALGTIFSIGIVGVAPFIFFCIYFIYSTYQEDKLMASQFPQTYPAYKEHTKRLIPFIF